MMLVAIVSALVWISPALLRQVGANEQRAPARINRPAFPLKDAKWEIRGVVVADSRLKRIASPVRVVDLRPGEVRTGKAREIGDPDVGLVVKGDSANTIRVHSNSEVGQNPDLGLPGVIVFVKGLEKTWSSFPIKHKTVRLRVDDKRGFDKKALTLNVGENLAITNLGLEPVKVRGSRMRAIELPGNEHLKDRTHVLFSKGTVGGGGLSFQLAGKTVALDCGRVGEVVAFTCSRGVRDFALLYMGAHHVQTVTDSKGCFRLPKLPDGDYELVAIHELLGVTTLRLAIRGGHPDPVRITFMVPATLRTKGSRSPIGRWSHAMVYDPTHKRTVVHGGVGNLKRYLSRGERSIVVGARGWVTTTLSDSWQWDGVQWWKLVDTEDPLALRRAYHAMVFDDKHKQILLFGGAGSRRVEGWKWGEWKEERWTEIACRTTPPGPRLNTAMTYDSGRHRVVLFGGKTKNLGYLSDTWEWDGTQWERSATRRKPSPRSGHGMVFDSARDRVVLFGGLGHRADQIGLLHDTWEWDGVTWRQVRSATIPPTRTGHAMAYDSIRRRTVLFGGYHGGERLTDRPLGDTWEWDGKNWLQIKPAVSPSPRWDSAMVYDSTRKVVVMFGGHVGFQSMNDLWEWDGKSWTKRL